VPEKGFSIRLPVFSGETNSNITFRLAAEGLPDSESIMVYKIKKPEITAESVQDAGSKLGFTGTAGLIDGGTKYAMLDETTDQVRQYSVWINSGAVEYAIVSPDKLSPDEPPTLPSEEEAIEIATNFLTQSGLMPDDALAGDVVTNSVKSGGTYNIIRQTGEGSFEIIDSYDTHLLVNFSRQINGIPVADSGGNKLGVRIGDKGEVISVLKVWREVEPYREYPIKSVEQAYNELISGKGSSNIPSGCAEITIDHVSLAYWMETLDVSQEYVLPVYAFTGTCRAANGDILENFIGWIEALK
jgi:hypothetical protein